MHGLALWEVKMKLLAERALQRQQEAALLGLSQDDIKALEKKRKWGATVAGASPGPGQSKNKREGPVTRSATTFHTASMVTVSPYAFTHLTGPYSHFVWGQTDTNRLIATEWCSGGPERAMSRMNVSQPSRSLASLHPAPSAILWEEGTILLFFFTSCQAVVWASDTLPVVLFLSCH